MKRLICSLCMWIAIVVASQLNAQGLSSPRGAESETSHRSLKDPKAHEMTIVVSSQDLYLDHEGLYANLNGDAYPVRSLEKHGNQWIATIVDGLSYCPRGHPLCSNCSQCHTERCYYFVKYCNKWR